MASYGLEEDSNDVTWMASTFTAPSHVLDHDTTFAPPNSPMTTNCTSTMYIPPLRHPLNSLTETDKASPIVGGVLDDTWYSYNADARDARDAGVKSGSTPIPIGGLTPRHHLHHQSSRTPLNKETTYFPYYYQQSHDITFRGGYGAALRGEAPNSVSSNQFLNESNLDVLHNSLLGPDSSAKKQRRSFLNSADKSSSSAFADNVFGEEEDELDGPEDSNNNTKEIEFDSNKKSCKILDPIIAMFLNTQRSDANMPHMITCIKEMLISGIITPKDLIHSHFLNKSADMMVHSSECREDAIFHLVTLFEKHILPPPKDFADGINRDDDLKLINNKCRGPLGKLAMAGNEELSIRAEKCLQYLGPQK